MPTFKVWVPDHGETESDAISVEDFHSDWAAETAAKRMWSENDGWEWMRDGKAVLRVQAPDGTETDFTIAVDFEPTFYAFTPPAPSETEGRE